jgi:hypothetical protein
MGKGTKGQRRVDLASVSPKKAKLTQYSKKKLNLLGGGRGFRSPEMMRARKPKTKKRVKKLFRFIYLVFHSFEYISHKIYIKK